MTDTPIHTVSDTAILVAAYRAAESARPAPLFRDPLAARLAGPKGEEILARLPAGAFMHGWAIVIRTCIIDDLVRSAVAGGADTVLNLGAGLDTRPYRLDLPPSLRWVEADLPHVIDLKERALAGERARCNLERVAVDLGDAASRRRFLQDVAARAGRVLVLTEGVLPYLTPEDVAELAHDLRAHGPFREWIVDYYSPVVFRYRRRRGIADVMKNAPFRFEPDDFDAFFARHGWRRKTARYIPEEADRLGRPAPLPWLKLQWLRLMLRVLPERKTRPMRQFMGYVVLEPGEA